MRKEKKTGHNRRSDHRAILLGISFKLAKCGNLIKEALYKLYDYKVNKKVIASEIYRK